MASFDQTEFLKRYMSAQPSLRAFVLSLVADFHLTEDVLQEVAIAAWAQYERYDAARPFQPWVLGIARNKAMDALRVRGRTPLLPRDVIDRLEKDAPAVEADMSDRRAALARCLDRLSKSVRELVVLRFQEELDSRVIARRAGRSLSAVRKALTRARSFLMACTGETLSEGTR